MDMFIDFDISYELLFISNVLVSDDGLNTTENESANLALPIFIFSIFFNQNR